MDKLKQGSKVKWLTLGEIATNLYRGAGIKKDEAIEGLGHPCVRYGWIHTSNLIYFDKCQFGIDENLLKNKKYAEKGDLLFVITSENIQDIEKSCAYIGTKPILVGGDIVVVKHNQNPKYLAYVLSTNDALLQKTKKKVKSKVVHSSIDQIKKLVIPVPSLEKQEEIVNLLDKFSELSKELEKELHLRKQQYEYYRDELLSFKQDNKIKWLNLGEIATNIYRGSPITKNQLTSSGEPCLKYGEIYTTHRISFDKCISYLKPNNLKRKKYCEYGDLLIPSVGETKEDIGACVAYLGKEKLIVDSNTIILKHRQNPEYLSYALSTTNAQKQKSNLAHKNSLVYIKAEDLKKVKVPVPSLEKQEEIVNLLNKFWKLSNDIKYGLPKEIFLRKQQYECYRDELLKFETLKI